jgi:DNA-binding response OmpR family regulator
MRIAVLDDEPLELSRIRETLLSALPADGQPPHLYMFSDSSTLMRQLKRETFDLLILDWQVPQISGFQVLEWAHEHLSPPPAVIMLTAHNAESDTVQALNAGASDYICKPYRPAEFIARVRNVLRHRLPNNSESPKHLAFGRIVFDIAEASLFLDGRPVSLTPREYQLALLLFKNQERPLSRQYLYEHLWPREKEFVSRSLDTHVYRLRSKLQLTAEYGWTLSTIYGYGYRLSSIESLAHELPET